MTHINAPTKHLTFQFVMDDASKYHVLFSYLSFQRMYTMLTAEAPLTIHVTTWSKLLNTLTTAKLVMKFVPFIQSRGSLCDCDWRLFWASSIQYTFYFLKSPLNITALFMYSTSSGLFQDINLNFVRTFHHIHARYMTRPSWYDHPNYIWWRLKIRNSLLFTYLHIPTTSSSAKCAHLLTFTNSILHIKQ